MRDLESGMQTRNVRRWQGFLARTLDANKQPYFSLPLSGFFGAATEAATRAFQRDNQCAETGTVNVETRVEAGKQGFRLEFELGPERQSNGKADLREFRPYFLVPLLEDELPKHPTNNAPPTQNCSEQEKTAGSHQAHFADLQARIRRWIAAPHEKETPAVTDVFVFSHGWHRNFYGAVQAYDRMASLIVRLRHRGRLDPPPGYRPLFLMLHWNSDPGEDEWIDRMGRRTKTSFLENIGKTFVPLSPRTEVEFINDFETIYDLLARTSSPDVTSLRDRTLQDDALRLTDLLQFYRIKAAPGADDSEKAAVVWTCYHDAAARQILLDQPPLEGRFISPASAVVSLGKFLVGSLGLVTILGAIFSGRNAILNWLASAFRWLGAELGEHIPGAAAAGHFLRRSAELFWNGWRDMIGMLPLTQQWQKDAALWSSVAFVLFLLAWVHLKFEAWQRDTNPRLKNASGSGVPLLTALSWVYLQIVCSILPLLALVVTFFGGRAAAWIMRVLRLQIGPRHDSSVPGLFDERFGKRDSTVETHYKLPYARDIFGAMTAFPAILLLRAAAKDSALARAAEGLRSQVAFFQMQRKGVEAGRDAAQFLAELMATTPEIAQARLHLTGHSFGGLVVCNAVRFLALDSRLRALFQKHNAARRVFSLTLLQAAISSSWFHCEEKTRRFVESTIACIYSGYDTANGFMYPVANNGRMAAGYAGLHHVGGKTSTRWMVYFQTWLARTLRRKTPPIEEEGKEPEHRGRFISLSEPPDLNDARYVPTDTKPATLTPDEPRLLNLDGSRLIYSGAVASGGGHGDVFKDAVINLIWAAVMQGSHPIEGDAGQEVPPIAPSAPADGFAAIQTDRLDTPTAQSSAQKSEDTENSTAKP